MRSLTARYQRYGDLNRKLNRIRAKMNREIRQLVEQREKRRENVRI